MFRNCVKFLNFLNNKNLKTKLIKIFQNKKKSYFLYKDSTFEAIFYFFNISLIFPHINPHSLSLAQDNM